MIYLKGITTLRVRLRLFILVVYLPAELDRNTTGQRIRSRAAAYIGSGNETAMEVTLATH